MKSVCKASTISNPSSTRTTHHSSMSPITKVHNCWSWNKHTTLYKDWLFYWKAHKITETLRSHWRKSRIIIFWKISHNEWGRGRFRWIIKRTIHVPSIVTVWKSGWMNDCYGHRHYATRNSSNSKSNITATSQKAALKNSFFKWTKSTPRSNIPT